MRDYKEFANILAVAEDSADVAIKKVMNDVLKMVNERPLSLQEVYQLGITPELVGYLILSLERLTKSKGDFGLKTIGDEVFLYRRSALNAVTGAK